MLKKMMLLALSAGALIAFAAPAAQAKISLQEPNGTPVNAGAEITATSSNTVTTIGGGNSLACSNVTLHLGLLGSGATITGGIGNGTASGCFVNGVVPATLTHITEEVEFEESGEGVAAFSFLFDAPAIGANECTEEGEVPLTWTTNTDIIHLKGGPLLGTGPEGCPAGAEEIHGTFTVETKNGTPVLLIP